MAALKAKLAETVAAHQRKKQGHVIDDDEDQADEFRFLDYTPCINRRPMDLPGNMRVTRMSRHIKVMICVTVYNEAIEFLRRTLEGVAKNYAFLQELGVEWEEVCVCVIIDGRMDCNDRLLDYAASILVYDETMLQHRHNGYDVTMHLFEKTVRLPEHQSQGRYYPPMQMIFAVKERNGGKLNSHLWFSAFARNVRPRHITLLQAGNICGEYALARLYQTLEEFPDTGGVGGQMHLYRATLPNPIEAAQVFENKVLNTMTMALETVFGYVQGLSGELAMYRWDAVRGEPLKEYFMMEEHTVSEMGPLMANMYLTEDEVLAFGLLSARNQAWKTRYVPQSNVDIPGPRTLFELMKARKRYINGSFLMWAHYVSKFGSVLRRTNHSCWGKLLLCLQFLFNMLQITMEWFMMAAYYLVMVSLFDLVFDSEQWLFLFNIPYVFLLGINVIYGLGSTMQNSVHIYSVSTLLFGLSMVLFVAGSLYVWIFGDRHGNELTDPVKYAALLVIGGHVGGALLHGQVMIFLQTFLQYGFMVPSFVNMLTIFSFANMHDISWVTKPGNFLMESKRRQPGQVATGDAGDGIDSKADAGVRARDASAVANALVKVIGAKGDGLDDTGDSGALQSEANYASLAHVVKRAVETEADEDEARRWAKVQQELLKQHVRDQAVFSSFRNRLMSIWLGTNLVAVFLTQQFNLTRYFAFSLASAVLAFMAVRLAGTVFFQLGRVVHTVCFLCCPKCARRRKPRPPAEDDETMGTHLEASEFVKSGRVPEEVLGVDDEVEHLDESDYTGSDDYDSASGSEDVRRRRRRRRRRRNHRDDRDVDSYSDEEETYRRRDRTRRSGYSSRHSRRSGRDTYRRRRDDSLSDDDDSYRRRRREDRRRDGRGRERRRRAGSGDDSEDHAFDMAIQEEDARFRVERRVEAVKDAAVEGDDHVAEPVDAEAERPTSRYSARAGGRTIGAVRSTGVPTPMKQAASPEGKDARSAAGSTSRRESMDSAARATAEANGAVAAPAPGDGKAVPPAATGVDAARGAEAKAGDTSELRVTVRTSTLGKPSATAPDPSAAPPIPPGEFGSDAGNGSDVNDDGTPLTEEEREARRAKLAELGKFARTPSYKLPATGFRYDPATPAEVDIEAPDILEAAARAGVVSPSHAGMAAKAPAAVAADEK